MKITAALVKELRERTGSGMMECKKALVDTKGDLDAAVENMRKAGLAKADKKASRTAAEGCVAIELSDDRKRAVMLEINSETDFVARSDEFIAFSNAVARCALERGVASLEQLWETPLIPGADRSVEDARKELVAKLGENINVRRLARFESDRGFIASYRHGSKIGVLAEMTGADETLGRDICMHIAASRPICVEEGEVPAELIAKEREIFLAQAEDSGKPAHILERIVAGRVKKFLGEVTLAGQPFVKDPDMNVAELLKRNGASVARFSRFEVGEGIEKRQANFAEEVMAQVRNA